MTGHGGNPISPIVENGVYYVPVSVDNDGTDNIFPFVQIENNTVNVIKKSLDGLEWKCKFESDLIDYTPKNSNIEQDWGKIMDYLAEKYETSAFVRGNYVVVEITAPWTPV